MEWQPIETAPKDGRPLLLWESDVGGICLGYYEGELWWDNFHEPWRFNPTSWMPLPAPPKQE